MTKRNIVLLALLYFFTLGSIAAPSPAPLSPTPEQMLSSRLIASFIAKYHYKKTVLDDHQSKLVYQEFLKTLDPNRSFFTQADIDSFAKLQTRFDNDLVDGNLKPAFEVFSVFNQRRIEHAKLAISLLETPFDFTSAEDYTFDRSQAAWPKDTKEINDIWRKRIKNDYLVLSLTGKSDEEVKKTLRKRYERLERMSYQNQAEDTFEVFINAYLRTIEPHTSYFSPRTSENFKINMSLTLEGIGAVLRSTDEYTEVQRVIKGGPADLSGLLHDNDKIIGVGQGENGEIVDVVGWRLDDVVDLIRGPKDSLVRLQVIPQTGGADGPAKTISIVRNKIKLEEQQAKKSVIDITEGSSTRHVGVISIPTFYMDFDAYQRGDEDYKSTTRDTLQLINELLAEKVEGIIIDLRGNGGGSLAEAISLTGLFIKSGPVVQVRENNGAINLNQDTDSSIAYSGPLAVLVDQNSASASEIFAGAIQDYGRGIVVGEPTFGKGTVQSIVDLNRHTKESKDLGQLKLTMAQFFRINGDSTQHRGVVPDIVFPTAIQDDKQGERALEHALPWDHIDAAKYSRFNAAALFDIAKVKLRHNERIKTDTGFTFLTAESQFRKTEFDRKSTSLLLTKRKEEREKLEEERLARLNAYRVSRKLEPLKSMEQLSEETESNKHDISDDLEKIQLRETASILLDTISANTTPKSTLTQR